MNGRTSASQRSDELEQSQRHCSDPAGDVQAEEPAVIFEQVWRDVRCSVGLGTLWQPR